MNTGRFSCVFLLLPLLLAADVGKPQPAEHVPVIQLQGDARPVVEVAGLLPEELKALTRLEQTPEQWQTLFAVYVENDVAAADPYRGDALDHPGRPVNRIISRRCCLAMEAPTAFGSVVSIFSTFTIGGAGGAGGRESAAWSAGLRSGCR